MKQGSWERDERSRIVRMGMTVELARIPDKEPDSLE
jgi:hypothetical protein